MFPCYDKLTLRIVLHFFSFGTAMIPCLMVMLSSFPVIHWITGDHHSHGFHNRQHWRWWSSTGSELGDQEIPVQQRVLWRNILHHMPCKIWNCVEKRVISYLFPGINECCLDFFHQQCDVVNVPLGLWLIRTIPQTGFHKDFLGCHVTIWIEFHGLVLYLKHLSCWCRVYLPLR